MKKLKWLPHALFAFDVMAGVTYASNRIIIIAPLAPRSRRLGLNCLGVQEGNQLPTTFH